MRFQERAAPSSAPGRRAPRGGRSGSRSARPHAAPGPPRIRPAPAPARKARERAAADPHRQRRGRADIGVALGVVPEPVLAEEALARRELRCGLGTYGMPLAFSQASTSFRLEVSRAETTSHEPTLRFRPSLSWGKALLSIINQFISEDRTTFVFRKIGIDGRVLRHASNALPSRSAAIARSEAALTRGGFRFWEERKQKRFLSRLPPRNPLKSPDSRKEREISGNFPGRVSRPNRAEILPEPSRTAV